MERLDRRHDVVVGQHHALRRAGRTAREDELERLVGGRWLPGGLACLPVLGELRVVIGRQGDEVVEDRGRELLEACVARIRRVAAGPQDEVAGAARRDDGLDRVDGHPKVERHEHESGVHRPVVGGREGGLGWRPGQDPVAGLEVEGTQPPGGDPRPFVELAERPGLGAPVVATERERGSVPVALDAAGEQVQQRGRHARGTSAGIGRHPSGRSSTLRVTRDGAMDRTRRSSARPVHRLARSRCRVRPPPSVPHRVAALDDHRPYRWSIRRCRAQIEPPCRRADMSPRPDVPGPDGLGQHVAPAQANDQPVDLSRTG